MLPFIVCDLDGTLFDNTHRRDLIPSDPSITKNWEAFNNACEGDAPIWNMIDILRTLQRSNSYSKTIFLTGRGENSRQKTLNLLSTVNVEFDTLLMRPMDDDRDRVEFKREVLSDMGLSSLDIVLEDDDAIIKMVRETFGCAVIVSPKTCVANK